MRPSNVEIQFSSRLRSAAMEAIGVLAYEMKSPVASGVRVTAASVLLAEYREHEMYLADQKGEEEGGSNE